MKNFVISLNSAVDRRLHICEEFDQKNVNFEFFDAINPNNLEQMCSLYKINFEKSPLTENEKSCFMSHFCLWKKAVEENIKYIAIFEDDIHLSKKASIFLNSDSWINDDIIKIEKTMKDVLLELKGRKKIIYREENYLLGELKSSHMGAGGYILSLKAAKDLIDYVNNLIVLDHIDQIIFKWYKENGKLKVYQINPVLCIQDCILNPNDQKFISSLQWRSNKKIKNNLFIKISKEIKRPFIRLFNLPYKVKLFFINN